MRCGRFVLLGCVRLFMDNIELIATFSQTYCCGCTVDWHEPCVLFSRNYNRLCLSERMTVVSVSLLGSDYYCYNFAVGLLPVVC